MWDQNLGYQANLFVSGFDGIAGLAAGHNDLFHVAGMAGGTFSVARLFTSTLDGLPPVAISGTGITAPRDVAVLVAPEPGTMAALGLGLAALLRRRRSARK